MAYPDFTLELLAERFWLRPTRTDLFPGLTPVAPPPWLSDALARGLRQMFLTERARAEFLVNPLLLGAQELNPEPLAIYPGQPLNVDPEHGLVGECDYILSATPPLPELLAPVVTILEAKRQDVESGIAQCAAQMLGARLFNARTHRLSDAMNGCVTTGEAWQFLRLTGHRLLIDTRRRYISEPEAILAALLAAVAAVAGATLT